jgi:superfamily I DNA and/or RNA helicase
LQEGEAQLAAGTAWLWARPEFVDSVDVLFVDEAGQMSLADVLAVSQAAKGFVMLGDPQQLEQPIQGTHSPGVDVSALQHVLGTNQTMPADSGLFLSETWRLSPSICQFTSELFYENRLKARQGLDRQKLTGPARFVGAGLWFVSTSHEGNQSSSDEETDIVVEIVRDLLQSGVEWRDLNYETHPLGLNDILIVSPYNAQVFNLATRLPKARIGTVDKFQGQEAPVVIYSMTTSSLEDAPRGMEFLYSMNRFNVATSRARCACILVGSPRLFEPECQTPLQMKLANVFCRYLEMSQIPDRRSPNIG